MHYPSSSFVQHFHFIVELSYVGYFIRLLLIDFLTSDYLLTFHALIFECLKFSFRSDLLKDDVSRLSSDQICFTLNNYCTQKIMVLASTVSLYLIFVIPFYFVMYFSFEDGKHQYYQFTVFAKFFPLFAANQITTNLREVDE